MQFNSLVKDISPPPKRKQNARIAPNNTNQHQQCLGDSSLRGGHQNKQEHGNNTAPSLAAIEAGRVVIDDHLAYFASHFRSIERSTVAKPRISIDDFITLYQSNSHSQGCHFVVHQHDHPIAGVHYDLRLQFSKTSTISFAIPYGLPGNAKSIRPNRMAIETRVHNLWNNLIESASRATGSLLIWDTGEYEILPYREDVKAHYTDDESDEEVVQVKTASQNLFDAFQDKHIRIRLHGHRLPTNYTISLRLPKSNETYFDEKKRPVRKRRRVTRKDDAALTSDDEEVSDDIDIANASEDDEDDTIRLNNAYTGATNSIGSIHQRRWFLSLDKKNSLSNDTTPETSRSTMPFYVMGRDVEHSIVTGRTADDLLADEGVDRFIGRKMWRPVVE